MATLPVNALCYGDCLDWMQRWDDATVDLIYLDPPFNSNATYNVLYASDSAGGAQTRAFNDTWSWDAAAGERLAMYEGATARPAHKAIMGLVGILGASGMLAYLTYMAERLEHMHRLLKPTGSLYLHCDPTASHYLKVLCDAVFGPEKFRNEITWRRSNPKSLTTINFPNCRDTILRYSRESQGSTFRMVYGEHDPEYVRKHYRHSDAKGWYQLLPLLNPNDNRPNLTYEFLGVTRVWRWTRERMQKAYEDGIVVQTKPGTVPRYKKYLHESRGRTVTNDWHDIRPVLGNEELGYPTQKPRALLERIITASSNEGDLVLDPFCGCGTTIDAARRLGRRWCGIDISAFAIDLIRDRRLQDRTISTYGIPADLVGARRLAADDPFAFESWAVTRLPGFAPNMKQRGDGGVDGRATLAIRPDDATSRLALAQVKGGKFAASYLRDFRHVIDREKAAVGCFTTLDPAPARWRADAKAEGVVHVSGHPFDRLNLWSIADYFDERLPTLPVMTDPYSGRPLEQQRLF